jgi:hypothetical protein
VRKTFSLNSGEFWQSLEHNCFSGAWNAGGERSIVFDGNSFTYKVKNVTQYSGTFILISLD